METVRCCCSISTHTNYHAYLYAHYRKYTDSGGNFHTHDTPDCPHMGAIYTMLEPRVDRLALAVSLGISHPFQNCYDGYPSAVAGQVTCRVRLSASRTRFFTPFPSRRCR